MWQVKGIANRIKKPIIARYRANPSIFSIFNKKYIGNINGDKNQNKVIAGLSSNKNGSSIGVYNISEDKIAEIRDADILKILPNGIVQKLWDAQSSQNVFYLTDRCNSNCIMCPQDNRSSADYDDDVFELLKLLGKEDLRIVCISGGEPTLNPSMSKILQLLKNKAPDVECLILTNGRMLSNFDFTKQLMLSAPRNTIFAIPIYSPIPEVHDDIVGVPGALTETIAGIHNLMRFNARFEIRIVITKNNYLDLYELSNFIGWNMPTVCHVAFMGMEVHGAAAKNLSDVWVEHTSFMDNLEAAVKNLDNRCIHVSVYNLPHCFLKQSLWRYSRKSISDWKCAYRPECDFCAEKKDCTGFFATSNSDLTEIPRTKMDELILNKHTKHCK